MEINLELKAPAPTHTTPHIAHHTSHISVAEMSEPEVDIDLTDPEVANAATKIQSVFKGRKARIEVR